MLSYSILFLFSIEEVINLTNEDHIVEYVGAGLFFVAGFLYFILYKRTRKILKFEKLSLNGNVFYLLLGVAFLFVSFEEISWGQRIIGFDTPEGIDKFNAQSEFNFHNLYFFHGETESGDRKSFWTLLLNMDRMFSIFWFSYCFLIPFFYHFSSAAKHFLDKIRMPIVPMFFAAIFLANYAASKVLEAILDSNIHHPTVEIKESNIAMLFFVLAIWFLRNVRSPVPGANVTV